MRRVCLFLLLSLALVPLAGRAALIAWYPLDEQAWNGSPGEIIDASGNGNNGQAVGNAASVNNGRVCRGGQIPANTTRAVQDAIDSGVDLDSAAGSRGTISFWFMSTNGWQGTGDHMLVDASTTTDNKYFFLMLRNNGRLRYRLEDDRDADFQLEGSARAFSAGEWHHVAVTWDLPAGQMQIYIDGALDASRTMSSTARFGELGSVYFGDNRSSYHPQGTNSSADGRFDEIRIYDHVQGAAEIQADMNATHSCGAIAEWRMEELNWTGAVGEVVDQKGAYPGIARNGALTASLTPAVAGSPGTCRYAGFDGNDDYIELPGFPDLTGSFTITAWIRPDRIDKDQRIFVDDRNNSGGFAFSLGDGGDGRLRFFSRNVRPVVVDTRNAVVAAGQWTHVAAVHDAAGKIRRIYVNGVAVTLNNGSTASTYTGSWGADPGVAAIGGEPDGSSEATSNWRFDGDIDEVRVYDAALDGASIAAIMNETHPCPLQPIAEYRFDECSYSGLLGEVEDSRGNYQATPLNGVNTNRPGVVNSFLDESLRSHQVRTDNDVPMNNAWSVSVWFRTPFVTTQRYHVLGAMAGGGDLLYLDRNRNFRWGVYVPRGRIVDGTFRFGNLADGWHHMVLVGTDQGARGETDLYIDGSFIERVNLQARGNLHYIGTSYDNADGASTQGFGTAMDEFTIFDYALSAEEIGAIRSHQQNGLNIDGTRRAAVSCQNVDHFSINVGAGNASTCSPFAFSITATDSSNNPVTDYSGSVSITTSTAHGNFAVVSATNPLSPNPDTDDNGSVSYSFDSADNGQIDLSLENQRAETLTISVSDSSIPLTSTSADVTFRDNAFVIEDVDAQVAGDNVPVAGRNHAYRIRLLRRDPASGVCGVATAYQGNRSLKLWRVKNAADPSPNAPQLAGNALPDSEPAVANANVDFTAGEASVSLASSDIGKYTLEAKDSSRSFADIDIAGGSAEQTVRPFGIGIDFGNLRDADFADNGSIDDSTGSDLSYAADAGGSVFTQAGEGFSMTVSGVLWQPGDDADNDGVPDASAYLGDNAVAPSFGAEGESVLAEVSVNAPAGATAESLVIDGVAGGLFNAFSGGEQTATASYGNVGIIDIQARLLDNDYFGSGVAIAGAAPNVGRFNPWQYAVTASSVTPACSSGSAFTYAREPFTASVTLQAQNKAGVLTDGYRAGFATLDLASELNLVNDRTGLAYDLESYSVLESFDAGNIGETRFDVRLAWNMPMQAPTVSQAQLIDTTDEVTRVAGSPYAIGQTEIRFGRMTLENSHGSELLDLPVPMRAEYYDGSNFLHNVDDGCSSFALSQLVLDSAVESGQTDGDVQVLTGQVSRATLLYSLLLAGDAGLSLCPPGNPACTPTAGNEGWVDLRLDLSARPWLRFDWDGDGLHDNDPSARATFGIFRGNERQIHLRRLFD